MSKLNQKRLSRPSLSMLVLSRSTTDCHIINESRAEDPTLWESSAIAGVLPSCPKPFTLGIFEKVAPLCRIKETGGGVDLIVPSSSRETVTYVTAEYDRELFQTLF
jgi:hypothetical protein